MACVLLGFTAEELIEYFVAADVAKDVIDTVTKHSQNVSQAYHQGKKVLDTAKSYQNRVQSVYTRGRQFLNRTNRNYRRVSRQVRPYFRKKW